MLKIITTITGILLVLTITWLSAWLLGAFSDTNENYNAEVELLLSPLLAPKTSRKEIIKSLNQKSITYNSTSLQTCKKHGQYWGIECGQSEMLWVKIELGNILNPVETGATIKFAFDENDLLINYSISIGHSFL